MTVAFPLSAIVGQEALVEALLINAVAPDVGGVLVRGERGTAKSTAVRGLAPLLPPVAAADGEAFAFAPGERAPGGVVAAGARVVERPAPLVELPIGTTLDRLVGALDLGRALAGEHAFEAGLLARAHRGILYVDEVNLLPDHLVDALLDAAATGIARVEREAVSVEHDARFILVGTMNVEEGDLRPQLLDRFGLGVEVARARRPRRARRDRPPATGVRVRPAGLRRALGRGGAGAGGPARRRAAAPARGAAAGARTAAHHGRVREARGRRRARRHRECPRRAGPGRARGCRGGRRGARAPGRGAGRRPPPPARPARRAPAQRRRRPARPRRRRGRRAAGGSAAAAAEGRRRAAARAAGAVRERRRGVVVAGARRRTAVARRPGAAAQRRADPHAARPRGPGARGRRPRARRAPGARPPAPARGRSTAARPAPTPTTSPWSRACARGCSATTRDCASTSAPAARARSSASSSTRAAPWAPSAGWPASRARSPTCCATPTPAATGSPSSRSATRPPRS